LVDKKTIKKYTDGDVESYDTVYRHYSGKILRFARGLVKDEDTSKDLVQEVFISLWEKRDQVDPNLNFDNYIFTITYNAVRKFFRKKSLENRVMDQLFRESPEVIDSTDREMVYNELLELANRAIDKLPPRRKTVYKLSRQEGMKIREIADKLNISPRTAEHHLASALKFLVDELSGNSLLAILFFYLFLN